MSIGGHQLQLLAQQQPPAGTQEGASPRPDFSGMSQADAAPNQVMTTGITADNSKSDNKKTFRDYQEFTNAGATGSGFGSDAPLAPGVTYGEGGYLRGGQSIAPWEAIDSSTPQGQAYWLGLQQGANPGKDAVPLDPGQYSQMYHDASSFSSHAGGGVQIPVGVIGSQFNPYQGNPNYVIGPDGYARFTDTGRSNLDAYTQDQLQSVYRNAAKNQAGLSGFLGTPMGGLTMLAMPAMIGGGVGLLGGAAGAAGAGAAPWLGTVGDLTSGSLASASGIAPAAAAAPAAASSGSGLLGSVGSFLAHPFAAMGLPTWVDPVFKGVQLANSLGSMFAPPPQGGQG